MNKIWDWIIATIAFYLFLYALIWTLREPTLSMWQMCIVMVVLLYVAILRCPVIRKCYK